MDYLEIQYPIIDLRDFVTAGIRSNIPQFPEPDPDTWLRNFGHVRNYGHANHPFIISESCYCDAHNAIRFPILPKSISDVNYFCNSRRFFSNGKYTHRVEVGLSFTPFFQTFDQEYEFYSRRKVRIKSYEKRYVLTDLLTAGIHLTKLYKDSTTLSESPIKSVFSGTPSVLILHIDKNYKHGNEKLLIGNIYVSCHKSRKGTYWIFNSTHYPRDKQSVSKLRDALFAILREKETLKIAYNFLLENKDNPHIDLDKVYRFIDKTQNRLLREIRFGISQSEFVDKIFEIDFAENRSQYLNILEMISHTGHEYVRKDFKRLFNVIDYEVWLNKIDEVLLSTNESAKSEMLHNFREVCEEGKKSDFIRFVEKYKIDIVSLNVFSNLLSRLLGI